MADQQRYVAKKIGDRYVTIPQDVSEACNGRTIGGALLALVGLARGGFLGKIALLAGGIMVYQGVTGENPLAGLFEGASGPELNQARGPSFQNDQRAQSEQKPSDIVEEASMESFPASDAPAHTTTTGA